MGKVKSKLDLILVNEPGTWTNAEWCLGSPLLYWSDTMQDTVAVPAGFITDLASVPRVPFIWFLAGGAGNLAAVIHDYLYRSTQIEKRVADQVFYEALLDTGTPRWRAWLMYQAVVLFGSHPSG